MTDARLCSRIRAGHTDAAEAIQSRHAGLIGRVINQCRFPATPESYQTGRIALHFAAVKYKADKATGKYPFAAFAAKVIRNEISRLQTRVAVADRRCGMHGRGFVRKGIERSASSPKRQSTERLSSLATRTAAPLSALAVLSPLPRIVCHLLVAGEDPVKRLGLYPGELDAIRERAYEEIA